MGETLLGTLKAKKAITLFDLVGMDIPQTALEVSKVLAKQKTSDKLTDLDHITNLAVFVQTLDEDGDAAVIPNEIHSLASSDILLNTLGSTLINFHSVNCSPMENQ